MKHDRFPFCHSAILTAVAGGVLTFGVIPSRAEPQGSVLAGKDIATNGSAQGAPACGACHGANGEGQPAGGIPRLTGLNEAYLARQLAVFGNGTRDNATMSPISKTLTEQSMADVAAYYASLPAPKASDAVKPAPQIEAGATLALHGDWSANIPACASCHGANGLGVGKTFPSIAGQSATYISNQLAAWKTGTRHDDPLGLMKAVAGRLSSDQIAAVAAYYETMPAPVAAKGGMP
jgi:cytochrome c553